MSSTTGPPGCVGGSICSGGWLRGSAIGSDSNSGAGSGLLSGDSARASVQTRSLARVTGPAVSPISTVAATTDTNPATRRRDLPSAAERHAGTLVVGGEEASMNTIGGNEQRTAFNQTTRHGLRIMDTAATLYGRSDDRHRLIGFAKPVPPAKESFPRASTGNHRGRCVTGGTEAILRISEPPNHRSFSPRPP
jgi:hypothetical protein